MNIYYPKKSPVSGIRYGLGFRSKTQLPYLMIWKEYRENGEVEYASVIVSSMDWFPKIRSLFNK